MHATNKAYGICIKNKLCLRLSTIHFNRKALYQNIGVTNTFNDL